MTETEVERMVVRLVGDGSSFQTMLKHATDGSQRAAAQVQAAANRIEGIGTSLRGFASTVVSSIASLGIKEFLHHAKEEWQNAELSQLRLTAAVEANGRKVEDVVPKYLDFATEMQKVIVLTDEAVQGLLRQAETFDLTGDNAIQAAKNAMALSTAVHGSVEGAGSMMRMAAALAKGDIGQAMMFARMIPQLRGVKNQTEFLAKANKLLESGYKTMLAEGQSSLGKQKILANLWGDALEEVGKIFLDVINPFREFQKFMLRVWAVLDEGSKRTMVLTAGVTALVLAIGPVYQVIRLLQAPLISLITYLTGLGVRFAFLLPLQLLYTGVLASWQVVVVTSSAALLIYSGALAVVNLVTKSAVLVATAWALALGAGSLALRILNATGLLHLGYLAAARVATILWTAASAVWTVEVSLASLVLGAWNAAITLWQSKSAVATLLVSGWTTLISLWRATSLITVAAQVTWTWAISAWNSVVTLAKSSTIVWGALVSAWSAISSLATIRAWLWNAAITVWYAQVSLAGVATSIWNVATTAFAAVMALASSATWLSVAAGAAWATGSFLASAATWVWNTALTVLNALLAPAALLAVVATVGVLTVAFVAVGAAVLGVYNTTRGLFDVFSQSGSFAEPIAALGSMFGDWFEMIKDIIDAVRVDMPLAWELMKAAFAVALNQVKDLWTPLLSYILSSAVGTWQYVSKRFVAEMNMAGEKVRLKVLENIPFATEEDKESTRRVIKSYEKSIEEMGSRLGFFFKELGAEFKIPVSDATKEAQEAFKKLREQLGEKMLDEAFGDDDEKAFSLGQAIGGQVSKGIKDEMKKMDAVLAGSAEALSRITEFRDLMANSSPAEDKKGHKGGGGKGMEAVPRGGADAQQRIEELARNDPSLPILKDIRDAVQKDAGAPRIDMEAANLA